MKTGFRHFLFLVIVAPTNGARAGEPIRIRYERTFGNTGSSKTGWIRFGQPKAACYDPTGNLYVVGNRGGHLQKIAPDGTVLWTATQPISHRWTVTDLVADASHVWVSDYHATPSIRKYSASDGKLVETSFEVPLGWWPWSLALHNDKLFAGFIHEVRQVWIYDKTSGRKISALRAFSQPRKLHVDPANGDLYAFGWGAPTKWSKASGYKSAAKPSDPEVATLKRLSTAEDLKLPAGLAADGRIGPIADRCVNPSNGDVAVVDEHDWSVYVFSSDGSLKGTLRDLLPRAVAADDTGHLFAVGGGSGEYDLAAHRLLRRLPPGEGVAWHAPSKCLFIAHGSTITKYRQDGKREAVFPPEWVYEPLPHPFEFHRGMGIGGEELYYSSPNEGKVKKIDLNLTGEAEGVLTNLARPSGIAFDGKGAIYVALEGSHRVRKYDTRATPWKLTWEIGGNPSSKVGDFLRPKGLAVCGDHLYVADSGNHRIKVYTLDGKLAKVIGTKKGREGLSFAEPYAITVVTEGAGHRIYVADTGNWRVLELKLQLAR